MRRTARFRCHVLTVAILSHTVEITGIRVPADRRERGFDKEDAGQEHTHVVMPVNSRAAFRTHFLMTGRCCAVFVPAHKAQATFELVNFLLGAHAGILLTTVCATPQGGIQARNRDLGPCRVHLLGHNVPVNYQVGPTEAP